MTRLTLYAVRHTAIGRTEPDPIDAVYLTPEEARRASAMVLTLGRKEIVSAVVDVDWAPAATS